MREIKFRIFDKEKSKIRFDFIIETKSYEKDLNKCIKDYDGNIIENVEIMQYTGLKDKNGKEIYEGDILKYKSKTATGFYKNDDKRYVEYENGYKIISPNINKKITLVDLEKEQNSFVVLGNIYENKNLLKKFERVSFDFKNRKFISNKGLQLARWEGDDKIYINDFEECILEYYIESNIKGENLWILTNKNKVYYNEKGFSIFSRGSEDYFKKNKIKFYKIKNEYENRK